VPKSVRGLAIPSFPQLYRSIKGTLPSGQRWEALRTIHEVNSTLQRLIAFPPGTPQAPVIALRAAMERLNNDKEFAAESIKTVEFAPDYESGGGVNNEVRTRLVASPEIRAFVAEYIKSANKQ
jgi:hypothetical protein